MPITNTDLPPKNTSIKYRRLGESHFTAGKTSKQQPKRKGKHGGYVNFLAENTEKEEYSVEWKNIEDWSVCDEEKEGMKEDEDNNSDESRKTEESSDPHNESYRKGKESSSESQLSDWRESSNKSTQSEGKEGSHESSVSIIDGGKETYAEKNGTAQQPDNLDSFMDEYNRELPPYQLPKENSEQYFSVGESNIVEKMHQMSIHDESEIEQFKTRKRTPIKEKLQKLRRELKNEKEKAKELEVIVNKITNEDSSEIRKELANALKTQNIYKEEVRKFMNNTSAGKNEIEIIDTDFHPNTTNTVHLKKCELINENSTLNKKLDKLQTELNKLQKSKDELSKQLREEKEKNKEIDLLQLKILELEAIDPQRGENEPDHELLMRKEAEIQALTRSLEESKYNINEWIKESNNLRRINHQLIEENSQVKAMKAKDEIIQSKNENIIMLQNETLNLYRQISHKKNKYRPNSLNENESPLQSSDESVVVQEPKENFKTSKYTNSKTPSKTKKRQGLPNEKKNACYIISAMHALAMSIPRNSQKKSDPVMKMIKDTRNCLEGHKNEEEAQKLIQNIWEYTISKWPDFYQDTDKNEKRIRQEDSAEYLRRIMQNDKILEETEMYINTNSKCYNDKCPAISNEERKVSNIVEYLGDKEEITLQEIIDLHVSQVENRCLKCQGKTTVTNVIKQAPNILIVEICRGNDDLTISRRKIKNPERKIEIEENGQKVNYKTSAIIKHQGEEQTSGHYILNCYNENTEKWEEIDDNEINILENMEKNESGLIYILKRDKSNQTIPDKEKQEPLYSTVAKRPGSKQQSQDIRSNYESQYSSMPRGELTKGPGHFDSNREREIINLKKNNVIIRGIPERNKENDIQFIVNMNKLGIGNHHFDRHNIIDVERIGDNYEKGRPLKVKFGSHITKLQMMRNLYLLKDDERYKGINIQHDLTKSQVVEFNNLIQKSIETEQKDRSGNYIYRVRGPPGKWEIVKLQKNSK